MAVEPTCDWGAEYQPENPEVYTWHKCVQALMISFFMTFPIKTSANTLDALISNSSDAVKTVVTIKADNYFSMSLLDAVISNSL